MPRTKQTVRQPKRAPREAASLGPGLHLVHVDLGAGQATTVRTLDGRRLTAVLGDDVDPALVDECRRRGRMMLACDTSRGPTLMGALQTRRSIEHEPDGSLVIAARNVRIAAEEGVSVEAGTSPPSMRVRKASGNASVASAASTRNTPASAMWAR